MGFLQFFNELIKKCDKSYEDICKERSSLKTEMQNTLKSLNFTEMEIMQVLLIIEESERKIEQLKCKLPGLSRRFDNPTSLVQDVQDKISLETDNMMVNIQNKIQEIMARKNRNS